MNTKKYLKKWRALSVVKKAGVVTLGVVAVIVVLALLSTALRLGSNSFGVGGSMVSYDAGPGIYGKPAVRNVGSKLRSAPAYEADKVFEEVSETSSFYPEPPYEPGPAGDASEDFEVTEYFASIETRNVANVCAELHALKVSPDIIFENANEYETGCNYTFKVTHQNVEQVVALIEQMDPDNFSENTYTIKRSIDNTTKEIDILENKLALIDETLSTAVAAYDDITALATSTRDVESLTRIIDSKIGVIERLTRERINVATQIDRYYRNLGDQMDRLDFTYFSVNVTEQKIVDGDRLGDSWKWAARDFVEGVNDFAKGLTLGLIGFLLVVLRYAVYLLLILLIAKYGWKFLRKLTGK